MKMVLFKKYALAGTLAVAAAGLAFPSFAADTVKIAEVVELTGPGTTSGTNFRDGTNLAIKEVNVAAAFWAARSSPPWATHSPTPVSPRAWPRRPWTTAPLRYSARSSPDPSW
ncbi:hypothetical protein CDEF62S_03443 [Castellaniella defragrans]